MASDKSARTNDTDEAPIQDRILASATDLFIRHGYNGVSFLAIAKSLGISHSHIHYYYRTKAVLAEAALEHYIRQATARFREIWTADSADLLSRFVQSRDWIYQRYLAFNPRGSGGQNWGLLARFASEAEAMSPAIRRMLRTTIDDMDSYIATGIGLAVARGELSPEAPEALLVLQISSLLYTSRNITRFEGGFQRLDDLLGWTFQVILRAYGTQHTVMPWPAYGKVPAGPPTRRRKT